MAIFSCGDRLQYGTFESGTGGCLVQFPELNDRVLLLTAGHVVLPSFAQQGDAIYDTVTGEIIGTLFAWTQLDGDPTTDAALIWIDPAKVSPIIRSLGAPTDISMQPAVGDVIRIAPHIGQTAVRETKIKAVGQNIDIAVGMPGSLEATRTIYRNQILTERPVSEGGDSGAIAVDGQGRVVGMVVAGSIDTGTVITPIAPIFKNAAWNGMQLQLVSTLPGTAQVPTMSVPLSAAVPPSAEEQPALMQAPGTPAEFIARISSCAVESMRQFGVPASVTLAQAALESSWGRSLLATDAFNLFGIKADPSWNGPTVTMHTKEFVNGEPVVVQAKFRRYDGWQPSVDDHAKFLRENPRYEKCFRTTDGESFAKEVAKAGYATDPEYADKITATMAKRQLQKFDV